MERRNLTEELTDAVAVLVGTLLRDPVVPLAGPRHCGVDPLIILNVCEAKFINSHRLIVQTTYPCCRCHSRLISIRRFGKHS